MALFGKNKLDNSLIEKCINLLSYSLDYNLNEDEKQALKYISNGINAALQKNDNNVFIEYLNEYIFMKIVLLKDTNYGKQSGFFEHPAIVELMIKYLT